MGEGFGVLAAVLSSALGGTSIGATRYLVNAIDPLAIGSFRFGIGFVLLLPVVLLQGSRWPLRRDWPAVAGLGVLFFAVFPAAVQRLADFHDSRAGGACVVHAPVADDDRRCGARPRSVDGAQIAWRCDRHARRRARVAVRPDLGAIGGVARRSSDGRRRALRMAFYSIWSKPFIARAGPIPFTTMAMGVGAICLILISCGRGSFAPVADFGTRNGSPRLISARSAAR